MTDLTKTIEAIKALPERGSFTHRIYHHQTDWDDIQIGTYAEIKALALEYERLRDAEQKTYAVIYGNYFPREVDSYWNTKAEADAQANKLNDEDELNSRMWEVEQI